MRFEDKERIESLITKTELELMKLPEDEEGILIDLDGSPLSIDLIIKKFLLNLVHSKGRIVFDEEYGTR